MSYSNIKAAFLLFILSINILQVRSNKLKDFFVTRKFHVQVVNSLPINSPILRVHCASKNDDIGYHDLVKDGQIEWSFREQVLSNTLYFCHFWWGSKDKAFEVFNALHGCIKDSQLDGQTRLCRWSVTDTGFFLEDDKRKKYIVSTW
uniref:S-protein homolog n=1 Tax=Nicotiana sylvestris TaxID=4096 RepID=A0A1U7WWU9_NICSY|nr:PREDICTED: uncharacterized protein LOC104230618 [Nicotiana sylvestris]